MSGRRHTTRWLLAVVLVGCVAVPAYGYTWHVAKDGSGDFTVIQDAVEAAADGDTIRIGPGRYDEFEDVYAPGWTFPAVVWVTRDDIVFIGAGRELTYVGPEEYYNPPTSIPKVFCCIDDYCFTIRDLTIENCYEGIYAYGRLEVMDCSVSNCELGVVGFTENGMHIDRTTLGSESYTSFGIVTSSPANSVVIANSEFVGNGKGASFTGTSGVQVQDCIFIGVRSALMFYGSSGSVRNCFADQSDGTCFIARDGSEIEILDCEMYGHLKSLSVNSGSSLRAENCIFGGGPQHATVHLTAAAQVSLNGCHILNGGGLSVMHEFYWEHYGFFVQDMTGNYWGTTDPTVVAEWIWDGNDDSGIHSIVNYLPMADGEVSVESHTWSEVKALFRDGGE